MDFNKLKEAADSIIIPNDMKNRIKAYCLGKKAVNKVNFPFKKVIPIIFTVLLILFFVGFPYLTHDGKVQTTGFYIKAYALNNSVNGSATILSDEKTGFEVSVMNRRSGFAGIGGNKLLNNYIFADIGFSCIDENIETITYTMSEGLFVQDVILTPEQFNDAYMKSQNIICGGKDPDAVNFEAVKQIGESVTISVNDPANLNSNLIFPYILALPCSSEFIMYDVTIKVIIKYSDNSMKSQDIFVTQKTNAMNGIQNFEILLSLKD